MARLDQGLLGGYSGKLGTTVGATWKGINVVRTYQPNVANPNTQAQNNQRELFRDVTQFASFFLGSLVKPFWDRQAKQMSGFNAFVSANVKSMKELGAFNSRQLIIGDGRLGHVDVELRLSANPDQLALIWEPEHIPLFGKETDRIAVIVFNSVDEPIGYSILDDTRGGGNAVMNLNSEFEGSEAWVSWAWLSEDGLLQSITEHKHVTVEEP